MVKKYKLGKVGMTRHPEKYGPERINSAVFSTVEEELAMWKAAEEIVDILNKEKFTLPQDYFIWHYVNFLKGVDNLSELAMFEFMRFRLFVSRAVDMNKPNGKDKK